MAEAFSQTIELNEQEKEKIEIRQKKEIIGIHSRLASVIRAITGRNDLKITTEIDEMSRIAIEQKGQSESDAWFMKYKTNKLTGRSTGEPEYVRIPKKIMAYSEEFALGAAAHEAAHVVSSRFGEFVPDEIMKQAGFSGLLASCEERPTDLIVKKCGEGGEKWITTTRRELLYDGDIAIYETGARATKPNQVLNYLRNRMHKYASLCSLIVFYPYYSEDELEEFDVDVLEAYEELKEFIEEFENEIPKDNKQSEEKITEICKRRYAILLYKIYGNTVEQLLEHDSEYSRGLSLLSDSIRTIIEDAMADDKELEADLSAILEDIDDFDSEQLILSNELMSRAKDILGDLSEQVQEIEQNAEEKEQTEDNKTETSEVVDEQENKDEIDLIEMSDKEIVVEILEIEDRLVILRKRLEDTLPDSLKELIEEMLNQQTKQIMTHIEKGIVEKHRGSFEKNPIPIPSCGEEDVSAEDEDEGEDSAAGDKQTENERLMREKLDLLLEEQEENKSFYEKIYEEVHEFEEDLYAQLKKVFRPSRKARTQFMMTGVKLNIAKLFLWEGAKAGGAKEMTVKPFEVTKSPEVNDFSISILVDLSASMKMTGRRGDGFTRENYEGTKIHETFKAVILLAEVLNRLGIRFNVFGFQNVLIPFKNFEDKLDDKTRNIIAEMLDEVWEVRKGGNNHAINYDAPCVRKSADKLMEQRGEHKFLIVLSDGLPCFSGGKRLEEIVEEIIKEGSIKLVGLGVGHGTEHVAKYYPASLPNITIKELVEKVAGLLKLILLNPKYFETKQ